MTFIKTSSLTGSSFLASTNAFSRAEISTPRIFASVAAEAGVVTILTSNNLHSDI